VNSGSIIALVLGIPTVAFTVLTFVLNVRALRGRRYLENARGLFELHASLMQQGHAEGRDASKDAGVAHEVLLTSIDRNARANAFLFNESAAMGGASFPTAIALILYGPIIAIVAIVKTFGETTTATTLIVCASLVAACVGVTVVGFIVLQRRRTQRRARVAIGIIDITTIEGMLAVFAQVRRLFYRWRRTKA
jgi:hypothetical protein